MKKAMLIVLIFAGFYFVLSRFVPEINFFPTYKTGEKIDSLNQVVVYYNGGAGNTFGRNTTTDGYNLGLKYQCVEFVKRYYYEHLKHKMPNSYGNAKDFFNAQLSDGSMNPDRNLLQFSNGSVSKPKVDDLLILDATPGNQFGHVGIVSEVSDDELELVQQNCGSKSRARYGLYQEDGKWYVDSDRVLGWLRKN